MLGRAAAAHAGAADGPRLVRERFGVDRMARGYARLYSRTLARQRARPGDGVLIVTNNFSTGGAQSSARRLLLAFQARGVRARAAVLEEQPEYPTIGRRALSAAGISVLALPPPADLPASESVARLLQAIDADPPRAVLLWNVIAEHKLRLAEGLLDVPLFDVSPESTSRRGRLLAAPTGHPYARRAYGARLAGGWSNSRPRPSARRGAGDGPRDTHACRSAPPAPLRIGVLSSHRSTHKSDKA